VSHDRDDGYTGPATVQVEDRTFSVNVRLAGHFQPLDGRYHWYGRLDADDGLTRLVGRRHADTVLSTPYGHVAGRVHDPDLWHRYRVEGTGTPPFPVPTTVAEAEAEAGAEAEEQR